MHISPDFTLPVAVPRWFLRFFASRAATASQQVVATRSIFLGRHRTLRLERSDTRVLVQQGCVWITRDHSSEDILLEAGQQFLHTPGARILVHALEDARLQLVRG